MVAWGSKLGKAGSQRACLLCGRDETLASAPVVAVGAPRRHPRHPDGGLALAGWRRLASDRQGALPLPDPHAQAGGYMTPATMRSRRVAGQRYDAGAAAIPSHPSLPGASR
jgi:hypothetical protein